MGNDQPQNSAAGISAAQFGQLPPASESVKKNVHPDAQGCRSTGGEEHVTQARAETYEQLIERVREVVMRAAPITQ